MTPLKNTEISRIFLMTRPEKNCEPIVTEVKAKLID